MNKWPNWERLTDRFDLCSFGSCSLFAMTLRNRNVPIQTQCALSYLPIFVQNPNKPPQVTYWSFSAVASCTTHVQVSCILWGVREKISLARRGERIKRNRNPKIQRMIYET